MPEQGFHRCVDGGEVPKEEHSLPLRASKILVSLGASVNLTLATGGERYGHFRSGGEGGGIRRPGREKRRCYEPPSRDRCRYITSGRTGSQRRPLGDPLTEAITPRGINQPLVINMRDLSSGALLYEISPSVLSISLPAFASFKSRYRVCDSRRRTCALRLEHSPETRCLSGAELKVRSHFPPAGRLQTFGS